MFKLRQCEDDDLDFSEDFLQDAFEVHDKSDKNHVHSIQLRKDRTTQQSENVIRTKSSALSFQLVEDSSGIDSLLDDDWVLENEGQESAAKAVNTIVLRSKTSSTDDNRFFHADISLKRSETASIKDINLSSHPNNVTSCLTGKRSLAGNLSFENKSVDSTENHSFMVRSPPCFNINSANVQDTVKRFTNYSLKRDSLPAKNNLDCSFGSSPRLDVVGDRNSLFSDANSAKTPSRVKRKFPGPAGILPEISANGKFPKLVPVVNMLPSPKSNKNQSAVQELASSQCSQCPFEGNAWQRMKRDFEIDDTDPRSLLSMFNIAWIQFKAAARQLPKQKAPVLIAVLKAIDTEGTRARVVFQDQSGEMLGTIHEKILDEFGSFMHSGTILVLKQLSVFSPPNSSRHYLNVHPSNVVALYSEGEVVKVQDLTGPHLLTSAEESLLEATKREAARRDIASNCKSAKNRLDESTSSGLSHEQHGKELFLFKPIVPNEEEDQLWENDDMDDILQNLDENYL